MAPSHELKQHYDFGDQYSDYQQSCCCSELEGNADVQIETLAVNFGTPTSPPISAMTLNRSETR